MRGRGAHSTEQGSTVSRSTATEPGTLFKAFRSAVTFVAVFAGLCAPWWVPPVVSRALRASRPTTAGDWERRIAKATRAGTAGIPVLLQGLGSGHRSVVAESEAGLLRILKSAQGVSHDDLRRLNLQIAQELAQRADRWDAFGQAAAARISRALLRGPLPVRSHDVKRFLAQCDHLIRFGMTRHPVERVRQQDARPDPEPIPPRSEPTLDSPRKMARMNPPAPTSDLIPPLPGGGLPVSPQAVPSLPPTVDRSPAPLPLRSRAPRLFRPNVAPPRTLPEISTAERLPHPRRPQRSKPPDRTSDQRSPPVPPAPEPLPSSDSPER